MGLELLSTSDSFQTGSATTFLTFCGGLRYPTAIAALLSIGEIDGVMLCHQHQPDNIFGCLISLTCWLGKQAELIINHNVR